MRPPRLQEKGNPTENTTETSTPTPGPQGPSASSREILDVIWDLFNLRNHTVVIAVVKDQLAIRYEMLATVDMFINAAQNNGLGIFQVSWTRKADFSLYWAMRPKSRFSGIFREMERPGMAEMDLIWDRPYSIAT